MSTEIQDLAARYSAVWEQRDPDAIVAMHTEDTVFHVHGDAEPAVGKAAVREAIAELLAQSPDLAFEPRRAHFGDDCIVSEFQMTGTAEGTPFACDGVDVIAVRDGRVARKDSYIDWVAYGRQVEQEAGAGTLSA